jgi:peptidoglycan/LPS O-acetylase OafA/YrhL
LSAPIPSLDGMRGVAILLVMFAHFIGSYPIGNSADTWIYAVVRSGWCGVDLFFALSGFLITGILLETRTASNYFGAFYMRRVLRIFPLYYAFLFLWFVVMKGFVSWRGWNLDAIGTEHQLWYWSYAANWSSLNDSGVPALGHLWSLAVEEQFYLVWPLVVWLVSARSLAKTCLVLIALGPAIRCGMIALGLPSLAIYEITPARLEPLALGALIAIVLRDETWHRIAVRVWKPMFVIAFGGVLAMFFWYHGLSQAQPLDQTLGYFLIASASAAAVGGAVLRGAEPSLLRWRPLRACGKYSYALYVLHYPLYCSLLGRITASPRLEAMILHSRLVYLGFIAVCFTMSFALALISWHVLEKRFLRLKDRFVPKLHARSA